MSQIFIIDPVATSHIIRAAHSWAKPFMMFPERFDSIVDAGAFCGEEAVVARLFNPKAKIISLEPCKEAFDIASKNVSGLNIEMIMAALGNGDAGTMSGSGASVSNQFVKSDNGETSCPSIRLSDIVSKYKLSGKMFVKSNCEGGEQFIFDHEPSLKILDAADVVLIECHGRKIMLDFIDLVNARFSKTHDVWQLRDAPRRRRLAFRMVAKGLVPAVPHEIPRFDADKLVKLIKG